VTVASKGRLGTGEGLTGCDGGPCPVSVYRGPETQVLRAKCSNTRVYCISLCKNTAATTEEESRFFPVPYITGGNQRVKESEWKMRRREGRRVKNRSGQWEGPGGGELDGCIMDRVPRRKEAVWVGISTVVSA